MRGVESVEQGIATSDPLDQEQTSITNSGLNYQLSGLSQRQAPTCRWAADIRSQSASADPVLIWTQDPRNAAPDIDPLTSICVTGFRNPGKDQLELKIGCAWIPQGLEPLFIPFQGFSAALNVHSHPHAPCSQRRSPSLMARRHSRHLPAEDIATIDLLHQIATRCGNELEGPRFRKTSPAIGGPFQQRAEHSSPVHSARAAQCRLRPGCWIGTSPTHTRGTEPVGGKQESTNGQMRIPSTGRHQRFCNSSPLGAAFL